jgi:arylsulfatase A-like enzyme
MLRPVLFGFLICCSFFVFPTSAAQPESSTRPNIVLILADDLGWGDLKVLNPDSKIATPACDRLATEGCCFTDVHSPSAVCSPTRYGILTGRYAWRSKLKRGVLGGLSPRLIEPGRMTLASMLKEQGYSTCCVGKWHLGMNWKVLPGKEVTELNIETRDQVWNVDYSHPIVQGPLSVGFDRYFGISASLDMVPYTFIENDRVTLLPSEDREFPLIIDHPEKGMIRKGPTAPGFDPRQVLPELTRAAVAEINSQAPAARAGQPFFLYFPLPSPHTPTAPSDEWRGKSGLNNYADYVMQSDHTVGAILDALSSNGLDDNTLVCFTSDNGPSPLAQLDELRGKGHLAAAHWRGHKADIYEGGHRIPLLVRWTGKIPAGSRSEQLVSLTDFAATFADILGLKLSDNAAEDSYSFLPAALGKPGSPRQDLISHSINGSFAYREKNWKLLLCPGSGGWSFPRPGKDDTSEDPQFQLYDLSTDPQESRNLQPGYDLLVNHLLGMFVDQVQHGRSTPGAHQQNTTPVDIWLAGREAHRPLKTKLKPQ